MADPLATEWNKYKYTSLFDTDVISQYTDAAVKQRIATLDPQIQANLDSLLNKFPNQSKDFLLSAAQMGLNANSKGIEKLATADGFAQLKQDLTNVDNIKSTAKQNKNFAEAVWNTVIYNPFKGATRLAFAGLQAPYQYVTTVGRDLYAMGKGEVGLDTLTKDSSLVNLAGQTTTLGQVLRSFAGQFAGKGPMDTGSGFFITPESGVGKAQAKAMSAYGRVDGQSFTLGRGALSTLGVNPNSIPYKVMSGIVDATLNVGLDPSTWFGPGSVTKIIKGGKELEVAKTAAGQVLSARELAQNERTIAEVKAATEDTKKLIKQYTGSAKEIKRDVRNTYMQAEKDLARTQKSTSNAIAKRYEKALNFTVKRGEAVNGNADIVASMEAGSVGDFVAKQVAENTPEGVIQNLGKLSADYDNTGGVFTGIFLNEVPQPGKLSFGARGEQEYVATISKDAPLNLYDISKVYKDAPVADKIAELERRNEFFGKLYTAAEQAPDVTKESIYNFIEKTDIYKASVDDLMFGKGSQSLADIIRAATKTKDVGLIQAVSDAVESTWKFDGYTNVRSIFGETGGVAITNGSKIGARQVGISNLLTIPSEQVLNPSSIGAKAMLAIRKSEEELTAAQKAFDDAKFADQNIDKKLKEIEVLRNYAAQDPELITQILNDPENIGLSKAMDLQLKIADSEYFKEFHRAEVGLIDSMGGSLSGDLDKAAKYVLGKRFETVANLVAKETNFARLNRLFGRKLDAEMVKELVDAKTSDEVLSIFLKHLANPVTDPKIHRSLTLKGQAVAGDFQPLFKTVAPVVQKAINMVENTERYFGRYFKRQLVLPLDDLDRLTKGLEDWMSSAKVDNQIIDDTINQIVKAKTTPERSKIVNEQLEKAYGSLAEKLAPGDVELANTLKGLFKPRGRENAVIKQYVAEKLATGELPSLNLANGKVNFSQNQALFEYQFLDDVLSLPDTKEIGNLVSKYKDNKIKYGTQKALDVFSTEIGDRWRTAQLAFRAAYIVRNVGEMQFRQYFSGHESLFNHPFAYLAMIAGDPNGGKLAKFFAKNAKYTNDVLGNKVIGKDAQFNQALSDFVEENFNFLARNHNSNDPRFAFVGKIYEAITPEDSRYHLGLANTLIRAHSDRLIPLVAAVGDTVDQDQFVKALIEGKDKYAGILEDLINGGRNGVESADFASLFLRDVKKTAGKYDLSPQNFNADNVKVYLFDKTSTGSVARYVSNVVGTGSKSELARKLLAYGEVEVNGKWIRIPTYRKVGNINDFADEDNAFRALISRNFKADEMTNSTVIHARDKRFGPQQFKYLDEAVNKFFDISTKIENVVNFSPEFRMSYWDHVGRYVGMVNDGDLAKLFENAKKSLEPLTMNGKSISFRRHPSLRAIQKEMRARENGKVVTDGINLETMNSMAAKKASEYTKNLFYNAAEQRQYANAMRIVFPFAQATFNTIYKWAELAKDNPQQIYKLARAYSSLTKPGSSAIYDITGTKYDDGQGFFYKDEFGDTRFRYPLAGSIIGALAGKNVDTSKALQLTAPVQSLNLAFGSVNPGVPGIGPMGQILYAASGKSKAFGPEWDSIRNIVFPFGEPNTLQDFLLPSWMKKTFLLSINNEAEVQKGVKDWASYLASSGDYGDNPLADDAARTKLFNDAHGLSRWSGLMTAFFQSIAPATPSREVFAKDKDGKLRTQTMLYNSFDQIMKKHPDDYFAAVGEFADTFGIKNVLTIVSGSTRNVRGTQDAWAFLNNHPDAADKYATATGDIVPYFFPGGEAATAYYNWQKVTGRRRQLSPEELQQQAENLVYQMAKSQISEQQASLGYSDVWYTKQIIALNEQFGGAAPVLDTKIGSAQEKIASIGRALKDPAFQDSPVYKETQQFYNAYQEVYQYFQDVKTSAAPGLGSGSWYAKERAKQLDALATQLMIQNPAFSRMYYGVFAGSLKVGD